MIYLCGMILCYIMDDVILSECVVETKENEDVHWSIGKTEQNQQS
jgi:hypothetical protein